MNGVVRRLEISDSVWAEFVASHPDAQPFHVPVWSEVLAGCYGYESFVLASHDDAGRIMAGLPATRIRSWLTGDRLVALPFSDYCPPLAANGEALVAFIDGLLLWHRENADIPLEVHDSLESREGVYHVDSVVRHVTELQSDTEQLFGDLKGSVRRNVHQAVKAGISVVPGVAWSDMHKFYDLHVQTRQRLGTPVQPLRYFRLLWDRIISCELGCLLLAYKDSQLVAGAVFLCWGETFTYKYGASDFDYWALRPNNLLFWHAIRTAAESGYRLFDWGKTEPENEGLRQFKRGWNGNEIVFHYSTVGERRATGIASSCRSRRLVTSMIERSPSWVCRGVGELLYGHFG